MLSRHVDLREMTNEDREVYVEMTLLDLEEKYGRTPNGRPLPVSCHILGCFQALPRQNQEDAEGPAKSEQNCLVLNSDLYKNLPAKLRKDPLQRLYRIFKHIEHGSRCWLA